MPHPTRNKTHQACRSDIYTMNWTLPISHWGDFELEASCKYV